MQGQAKVSFAYLNTKVFTLSKKNEEVRISISYVLRNGNGYSLWYKRRSEDGGGRREGEERGGKREGEEEGEGSREREEGGGRRTMQSQDPLRGRREEEEGGGTGEEGG
uniref:hypothetical protein n=1 Tax=Limnohabitans sp. TaxID=1907725 RepID=UPI002AFE3D3B